MTAPSFSPEIVSAIKAHAIAEYPSESCGFVTASGYVEVLNIAADPVNTFEVSGSDFLEYEDAFAFIHSHSVANAYDRSLYPAGLYPNCPSTSDMMSQIPSAMTWGIVVTDGQNAMDPFYWGDFILDEPLYDVGFISGVNDSYSLVRKWFWQNRSIALPDTPRDKSSWLNDDNFFVNMFRAAGFVRVGSDVPRLAGDCGLIQIDSPSKQRLNHAFLYLGDGTIAHHVSQQVSKNEAMGGLGESCRNWYRFQEGA